MFMVQDTTAKTGRRTADFLELVHPDTLKKNEVGVVLVYLKNITRAQIDAYHKAGLGVILIHEARATDGLAGAAKGTEHGRAAALKLAELGAPVDVPVMFSSAGDYDNTPATLPASVAYWRAAKKAAVPYLAGCYGDWDLLDAVGDESALNMQTAAKAWSWNWLARVWRGAHRTAHLVQMPSTQIAPTGTREWPGIRVDFSDVLRPIRAWYPAPPQPPKPVAPPAPKPPASMYVPRSSLKLTMPRTVSGDVLALRKILRFFGWTKAAPAAVYDRETANAVKIMQTKLGVTPDGWYYTETRQALEAFLAFLKNLPAGR